jgi:hypothetical protein
LKEVFQLVNKSEEEEADVVDTDFRNTGQTNHSLVILVSLEYGAEWFREWERYVE